MTARSTPGMRRSPGKARASWEIVPLGDRCLMVEFEALVDEVINRKARALAQSLLENPLPGVVDVVPAFCTVAVYYRPEEVMAAATPAATASATASARGSPYQLLRARVAAVLDAGVESASGPARVVRVPVCYGGGFGPDLEEVAAACALTPQEVIDAHVRSAHIVYMLGFSPGFPYIGGLDPRLSLPRRMTPRTRIPAGTVAIARDQTAIYSYETPGGWNLLGRTPLRLFNPLAEPPCRLQAGDRIEFVPITPAQFEATDPDADS